MQIRIRSWSDFWAGLLFVVAGVAAAMAAREYPMGGALRMGPGYFPVVLSGLMTGLGALIAARALFVEGDDTGAWSWRPLLVLGAAFTAFGFLLERIGFVPSLLILVAGAALAGREFRLGEVVLLAVVLTGAAVGLFVYALELPLRLFWWN